MKIFVVIQLLIWPLLSINSQVFDVQEKFDLPSVLNESSGAIFFNNRLISHNDSGNQNILYELDTISGLVARTITISNASNIDWEDITQDDTSIYIGDIGNNNGNRTDLKIYKINKNDFTNSINVNAEVIRFSYADQTSFSSNPNNTEWDSESLFCYNDSLVLLTKNWVTGETKAYPIPKNVGVYSVEPFTTSLFADGLITGATYNASVGKLYSIGYNSTLQPFIWISEGFSEDDIFSGTNSKILLSSLEFEQIEAITHMDPNRYFITSESFSFGGVSDNAKLISFSTDDALLSLHDQKLKNINLYPNPASDIFFIEGKNSISFEIYDLRSRLIYRCECKEFNMAELDSGLYLVKVYFSEDQYFVRKIIKK